MSHRHWFFAGFGMVLAITGGIAEARGMLVVGGVTVVTGLFAWVIFSGSSFLMDPFYTVEISEDEGAESCPVEVDL